MLKEILKKRSWSEKGGQTLKKIGEAAEKSRGFLGDKGFFRIVGEGGEKLDRDPHALNRLGYPLASNHLPWKDFSVDEKKP